MAPEVLKQVSRCPVAAGGLNQALTAGDSE